DRVRNASTVWLGATLGCAECHDHKFDPFLTKEFYRFAAFFADIKEKAVGRQDQDRLPLPAQATQLRHLEEQMAPLQTILNTQTPELDAALPQWEDALLLKEVRGLPQNLIDILLTKPGKRSDEQKQTLAAHYRTLAPLLEPVRKKLAVLQR